jgi:23S rRNA-/tRNA-specific pseudouridylate synthase
MVKYGIIQGGDTMTKDPGARDRYGTGGLGLLAREEPGLRSLHRLDKETSGVVVAARGGAAEERLQQEFAADTAAVEYLALVRGTLEADGGLIDVPLGKRRRSDTTLEPDPAHGASCATRWTVSERLRGFVLLAVRPLQGGRSHQVRAHLSASGMPVLCDRSRGRPAAAQPAQARLPAQARTPRAAAARAAGAARRALPARRARGALAAAAPPRGAARAVAAAEAAGVSSRARRQPTPGSRPCTSGPAAARSSPRRRPASARG